VTGGVRPWSGGGRGDLWGCVIEWGIAGGGIPSGLGAAATLQPNRTVTAHGSQKKPTSLLLFAFSAFARAGMCSGAIHPAERRGRAVGSGVGLRRRQGRGGGRGPRLRGLRGGGRGWARGDRHGVLPSGSGRGRGRWAGEEVAPSDSDSYSDGTREAGRSSLAPALSSSRFLFQFQAQSRNIQSFLNARPYWGLYHSNEEAAFGFCVFYRTTKPYFFETTGWIWKSCREQSSHLRIKNLRDD